jgi:Flp pilus assembly protein TadD
VALNATGRYEEAVRSLDKFLEANPEHSLAWKLKGDALSALGRNKEAQAAFEMARVG